MWSLQMGHTMNDLVYSFLRMASCNLLCVFFFQSVVFDLPTTSASTIAETWNDGYVRLSECLELPELLERSSDFYHRMRCNNSGK